MPNPMRAIVLRVPSPAHLVALPDAHEEILELPPGWLLGETVMAIARDLVPLLTRALRSVIGPGARAAGSSR
jgi:hypothetical protein